MPVLEPHKKLQQAWGISPLVQEILDSLDHARDDCPVWPRGIGEALSVDVDKGKGLHNLTAIALKHSPEMLALPLSDWGVPDIARMTDDQKAGFMKMLGMGQ